MGKDPVVKTIKHAKALSLKKGHKIRKLLNDLLIQASTDCGFCKYYFRMNPPEGCIICEVKDKCHELDIQVNRFLEGSLTYIEKDLIPFIENFEPKE